MYRSISPYSILEACARDPSRKSQARVFHTFKYSLTICAYPRHTSTAAAALYHMTHALCRSLCRVPDNIWQQSSGSWFFFLFFFCRSEAPADGIDPPEFSPRTTWIQCDGRAAATRSRDLGREGLIPNGSWEAVQISCVTKGVAG